MEVEVVILVEVFDNQIYLFFFAILGPSFTSW